MIKKSHKILLVILIIFLLIASLANLFFYIANKKAIKNYQATLSLFNQLTKNKIFYKEQEGELFQFPENVKICSSTISSESDANQYYGLKTKSYNNIYDIYSDNSQYASDVQNTANNAENLINFLIESGFIESIKIQNKKPAIMLDIDNTLEFTSRSDDDLVGDGPPIKPMVEFVKKNCFQKGIDCYFITARPAEKTNIEATKKWLKKTFNLSDTQLKKYVFLIGNFVFGKKSNICSKAQNTTIAYKDVLRQSLTEKDNVYWIMSIGDQLTDVYGEHSGIKILVPNLLFNNAEVPNPYYGASCARTQIIEASPECYCKLKNIISEESNIDY